MFWKWSPCWERVCTLNSEHLAIWRADGPALSLCPCPGLSQQLPRPGVSLPASGASGLTHQPRPAGGQQWWPPLCPDCPTGEGCPRIWGQVHMAQVSTTTIFLPCCSSRLIGYPWQPAPSSLIAPAASRPGTHYVAGASYREGECGRVPWLVPTCTTRATLGVPRDQPYFLK